MRYLLNPSSPLLLSLLLRTTGKALSDLSSTQGVKLSDLKKLYLKKNTYIVHIVPRKIWGPGKVPGFIKVLRKVPGSWKGFRA